MSAEPVLFSRVAIIGLGLIGSSLARVLRAQNIVRHIVGADTDKAVCDRAAALNLADTITADTRRAVMDADLVIICVPVGAYAKLGESIGPALKAGCIVTDVGSVKHSALGALLPHLPESVSCVPAHPIAGTEHSGPDAGLVDLFIGRWCILTPLKNTPLQSVEAISALWERCGARIAIMDPQHHDRVLAMTSHLPHLIAYAIVDTAVQLEDDMKGEVIQYSASGFRGFTRIAASDPVMWRDVFLSNKDAVLEVLQRFTEDLTALQKAIRRGDGAYLQNVFTRTRAIRRDVMGLGPEGFPAPPQVLREDLALPSGPLAAGQKSPGQSSRVRSSQSVDPEE